MIKKTVLIILSLVLLLSIFLIAGCTNEPASSPTTSSTPSPTTSPAPSPATEQVYNFRCPHFLPKIPVLWDYFENLSGYADEISGGRINITMYPGGQIVPVTEMWDAVASGAVEMAYGYGALWLGKTPMAHISNGLPFTCRDMTDAQAQVFYSGLEELVRKEYQKHNIYLVALLPVEESVLFTNFPVEKVDDLKGHKLRLVGMFDEMAPDLGVTSVFVPTPDKYMSLEQGIIDGLTSGRNSAISTKYAEVTDYYVTPPWQINMCDEVLMNLDVWNSLPDEIKAQIRAAALSTYLERLSWLKYMDTKADHLLQTEYGLTKTVLPDSEMAKLADIAWKVYDEYAAESPEFAEALTIIKDYYKLWE